MYICIFVFMCACVYPIYYFFSEISVLVEMICSSPLHVNVCL